MSVATSYYHVKLATWGTLRMERRNSGKDIGGLISLAVFIGVIAMVWRIGEGLVANPAIPITIFVIAAAIAVALYFHGRMQARRREREAEEEARQVLEARHNALLLRYQDPVLVQEIMSGSIWHDMTKEQLIDAWGHPADVETKVMKTKVREVYKFGRRGANRFARRVTLENDLVVGWEEK